MPFDAITVSALCREAGVHRGTFYLHYRNTMEVLDELLDDALENVCLPPGPAQESDCRLGLSAVPPSCARATATAPC